MRTCLLVMGMLLLMSTVVQAQLPTVVNGSFEDDVLAAGASQNTISGWFHRTAYCWVK